MLRIHILQVIYNYSDPGMEDALYEIESLRRFAGLRLSERMPDETTILNFRHLLEAHGLGRLFFDEINGHLEDEGYLLRQGTIVDATLISAPTSTKNKEKQRDPEMHQTKKGNQWYFGIKLHIGVDADSGLVHSAVGTSANEHDITKAADLLHGDEKRVHGDAGYVGIYKREEHEDREVEWHIAVRPGKRKTMAEGSDELKVEQSKASVRAKVEHPFRWVKGIFGYDKVRYRGLDKNMNRLYLLLGFTNLLRSRSLGYTG
jgi:IS5 family transposase